MQAYALVGIVTYGNMTIGKVVAGKKSRRIMTTLMRSHFQLLKHKATSEQRPRINKIYYFWFRGWPLYTHYSIGKNKVENIVSAKTWENCIILKVLILLVNKIDKKLILFQDCLKKSYNPH